MPGPVAEHCGTSAQVASISTRRFIRYRASAISSLTTVDGRAFKAGASTVTVAATGNATVTRNFSANPRHRHRCRVPSRIGTIVSFWGTKAEADQQKAFGWWPCDGSKIPTSYRRCSTETLPIWTKCSPRIDLPGWHKWSIRDLHAQERSWTGLITDGRRSGRLELPKCGFSTEERGWKPGALQKVQVTVPQATVSRNTDLSLGDLPYSYALASPSAQFTSKSAWRLSGRRSPRLYRLRSERLLARRKAGGLEESSAHVRLYHWRENERSVSEGQHGE